MTEKQFADMYAQTVVYGLFSARCMDDTQEDFSAAEAIHCIPNTNPFLKSLMQECLGAQNNSKLSFDELEIGNVVDLLLHTKTVSIIQDFNRQTGGGKEDPVDCLKYIRQLKDKNIPVFFEKEAINTMDAKGEVLLTIMASLAQQESQSLSQNVRLGLQYRYQQGKVQVCTNRFLGYDKDEDGNLVINPEEAKVVKRIYREYLGAVCQGSCQ